MHYNGINYQEKGGRVTLRQKKADNINYNIHQFINS